MCKFAIKLVGRDKMYSHDNKLAGTVNMMRWLTSDSGCTALRSACETNRSPICNPLRPNSIDLMELHGWPRTEHCMTWKRGLKLDCHTMYVDCKCWMCSQVCLFVCLLCSTSYTCTATCKISQRQRTACRLKWFCTPAPPLPLKIKY
jgi:hypothetical protein